MSKASRKKHQRRHQRKRNGLHQRYYMNERFPGSNGHHVSKETVIFIPVKLHRSVPHNIWNGKNMDKINELAFEWFYEEWQRLNMIDTLNMIE